MLFLERAGIQTDIKGIHQFVPEGHLPKASEFFERAAALLDQLSVPVMDNIRAILENGSGRWNPMGFMVLPLGGHPELGILRLHVWPKDLRKITTKGEPIHNHAWHLESRILKGEYADKIYTVKERETSLSEEERRESGFLKDKTP